MSEICDQVLFHCVYDENISFKNCIIFYAKVFDIKLTDCQVFGFLDCERLHIINTTTDISTNASFIHSIDSKIKIFYGENTSDYVVLSLHYSEAIIHGIIKHLNCMLLSTKLDFGTSQIKTLSLNNSKSEFTKIPTGVKIIKCYGHVAFNNLRNLKSLKCY